MSRERAHTRPVVPWPPAWIRVLGLLALCAAPAWAQTAPSPAPSMTPKEPKPGIEAKPAETPKKPKLAPPKTIQELKAQIEGILRDTHTPGAGVAVVNRTGPYWVAGLGMADVAAGKPATPDTLFRIGSTSKAFVSLSILKLELEGKLSLQDTLRSRAPEVEFSNPWEATDPVRLVNLLEHTSGWGDLAFREYAYNPQKELALLEGLQYHPRSRTSRWRPGTLMSYANSGPAAAAYVVEKVTGRRFEDYVTDTWFRPLGMTTASYFDTPEVRSRSATLYHLDGKTPYPYWHLIIRPAGAINASAREMANYVQFYLNRGSFGGVQLLPPSAIDRMEKATSSAGAREGLVDGYGLSNYASIRDGWVYHGHNGGVEGGLTDLSYLPRLGVGYIFMINSGSGEALAKIGGLVRGFITRDMARPAVPAEARDPAGLAKDYRGWYEPINPRNEITRFADRIFGLRRAHSAKDGLVLKSLSGHSEAFVAITDRLFRGRKDPVPTLALTSDRPGGRLIVRASGGAYLRIPAWWVWTELATAAVALLLAAGSLIFAAVWIPRKVFRDLRGVGHLWLRTWPLLSALSFIAFAASSIAGGKDAIGRLGHMTAWSLALWASTLLFAGFALLGLEEALRLRGAGVARLVWWHSFLASAALSAVAAYLAYFGLVGFRSWA